MPTNGLVASDTINFSEEFKNITGTTVGDNRALDVNVIATVGGGGGGGSSTEYTEDAASIADPVGGQLIARRRDTLSSETTTDGDVTALNSTLNM